MNNLIKYFEKIILFIKENVRTLNIKDTKKYKTKSKNILV